MTSLSITISVEPLGAGKAEYLPLGVRFLGGMIGFKICLRLPLHDTGTIALKVTGISYIFPGSGHATSTVQDVDLDDSPNLSCRAVANWSNAIVSYKRKNSVYLNETRLLRSVSRSQHRVAPIMILSRFYWHLARARHNHQTNLSR